MRHSRGDLQGTWCSKAVAAALGNVTDSKRSSSSDRRDARIDDEDLTRSEVYRSTRITFDDIVTVDPTMQAVLQRARRVAATDLTVLITGESGTGKNLLAQAIHTSSRRMLEPFVSVNCSALTETLLESELFGHERGSFTGADRERRGKFELARAGTLFLDEIGDLSATAQAKILRAIEYRQFERVGGEVTLISNARFIAATNRDLPTMVRHGLFREDAYYRLAEFAIHVPSLRERVADIPLLVKSCVGEFVKKHRPDAASIHASESALLWAAEQPWPGNIRQLRNVIKAAVILCERNEIDADALAANAAATIHAPTIPSARAAPEQSAHVDGSRTPLTLAEAEQRHVAFVMTITNGNKSQAARMLGITRPTLDRKLAQSQTGDPQA